MKQIFTLTLWGYGLGKVWLMEDQSNWGFLVPPVG
jgi:hypothetical protein